MLKTCGVICAALLLAACTASTSRPQPPRNIPVSPVLRPSVGEVAYHIDAASSELRLLVYRAGALARLGHNHVILNRDVDGWVKFAGDATAASFLLSVPVAKFVVDDAQARSDEGADFAEEVPEDAKAGTRRNMLSSALLDGERFPVIMLTSVTVARSSNALIATMAVDVAGHPSTLVVPFQVAITGGSVTASGTTVLRQSSLGLTPFSALLGALLVQDEIKVKFKLVAVPN